MTIASVQLIMGGLGILTGLLIALFGPGRRWIRWLLALATGTGIAITGWPSLWFAQNPPTFQLYQSLFLAAVVVLLALLTIMLLHPSRAARLRQLEGEAAADIASASEAFQTSESTAIAAPVSVPAAVPTPVELALEEFSDDHQPGRDSIALQLEKSPNAMIANQKEHAMMHLLSSAKKSDANRDANTPASRDVEASKGAHNANDARPANATPSKEMAEVDETSKTLLIETTTNAPSINELIENETSARIKNTDGASGAEVVSLHERRVRREGEAAADALDLSDSEELYKAMRDAEAELELPEDSTWLDDEIDTEIEDRPLSDRDKRALLNLLDEDIEDAEILDIGEALENDATTADLPNLNAHGIDAGLPDIDLASEELMPQDDKNTRFQANAGEPVTQTTITTPPGSHKESTEKRPPLAAPAPTLEAALSAQRHSIARLSTDTDTLASRLQEWRKLSDQQEQSAWQSSLRQGKTVQQQQQRIIAENNFRSAAVDLIRTQRDVMRQLMNQISTLGEQREEDLASLTALQETSMNQQRLARQAALLARKAAAEKQTITDTLRKEQLAHARTRSAAKRAMGIARDAVDKLAVHERRLGFSNDHKKP